ncbi:PQQ-dependent sugar dehydrogenase [Methylophilus sp.]|uniref:PQQ-dependent sugar dehydrogenase n=2 Tax=Methylophilus sp. TaxID=29541 RepID=UPI0040375131
MEYPALLSLNQKKTKPLFFKSFLLTLLWLSVSWHMLQPAAQAGEGVVPRLLLSGSDAAEADKEANKEPEPPRISSVFGTQNLKVYKLPFEDSYPSGPFERLDKHLFLFISKCGDVYFVRQNETLELVKPGKQLAKFIPGGDTSADESSSKQLVYCKELSGVKDSLLIGKTLYVAYTAWDEVTNGVRLAVSEFAVDVENSEVSFDREIYISRPAIKEPILGHQVGGKLALGENERTLYLSIGDFSKPDRVQDKTTSLGKVMRIDLQRLNAEVHATGFRSPSGGLFYDKESNELWLTDHGPRGGDEINLIKRGKNYGWPVVSYGTIYERDGMSGYYGNKFNSHEGHEKPLMTFVPSIGIGPLAKYPPTGRNDFWDNDLFVAGMGNTTLYRVRREGTTLVYAEPVLSDYRIRAIQIDANGTFYLKTDHNQLLISEQE